MRRIYHINFILQVSMVQLAYVLSNWPAAAAFSWQLLKNLRASPAGLTTKFMTHMSYSSNSGILLASKLFWVMWCGIITTTNLCTVIRLLEWCGDLCVGTHVVTWKTNGTCPSSACAWGCDKAAAGAGESSAGGETEGDEEHHRTAEKGTSTENVCMYAPL